MVYASIKHSLASSYPLKDFNSNVATSFILGRSLRALNSSGRDLSLEQMSLVRNWTTYSDCRLSDLSHVIIDDLNE